MKNPPVSGSERKFTEKKWGTATGIGNNNCYAYAVGDYESYRWQKSIPGDRSGLSNGYQNYTHCTSALFLTTQQRSTVQNQMRNVRRGTIKS